jgi:hypothetical protein
MGLLFLTMERIATADCPSRTRDRGVYVFLPPSPIMFHGNKDSEQHDYGLPIYGSYVGRITYKTPARSRIYQILSTSSLIIHRLVDLIDCDKGSQPNAQPNSYYCEQTCDSLPHHASVLHSENTFCLKYAVIPSLATIPKTHFLKSGNSSALPPRPGSISIRSS